ncbi:sulfatase [Thioclava sp. BHET1]|nr:sulfatase [Thioclava sp. BHET1]
MKFVFVLFDSLNRHGIGPYGGDIETPNFDRFAARGVTFDNHYVGSLPCMPARRDMQTGRPSFMHRSWGPLEPFDRSIASVLRENGIYTHLITDHFHYFEEGGAGYHTKFNSWEFMRGQEHDQWKALVAPPFARFAQSYAAEHYDPKTRPHHIQHMINMDHIADEAELPGPACFEAGLDFLRANGQADDWFLQLELFDPHEPFHVPGRFRRPGDSAWTGGILNWPAYDRVKETPEEIAEIRANYAGLVRMCDEYFGKLLDHFDTENLWEDTVLMVSTDHGFLLSEHEWWGKCRMPSYEEVTHIPLMLWHPDHAEQAGTRRTALTWTPDLMPTVLDTFGIAPPAEVRGQSILPHLGAEPESGRVVSFAIFGGPIGVTDGRYVMFHRPPDFAAPGLHEYTLSPQHMRTPFSPKELATATLHPGFGFTQGIPVLKIEAQPDAMRVPQHDGQSFVDADFALYDIESDPHQTRPIRDARVEARLYQGLAEQFATWEIPSETLRWYALDRIEAFQ